MGQKSRFVAFILWCGGLFLMCGLHRIYVGRLWTGVLWFLTLGLCGIGQLIDLFRLGDMVQVANGRGADNLRYGAPGAMVAPAFNISVNAASTTHPPHHPETIAGSPTRTLPRH